MLKRTISSSRFRNARWRSFSKAATQAAASGGDEYALSFSQQAARSENLSIGHRDARPFAFSNGFEHQENAACFGDAQATGDCPGVVPKLCLVAALLEGPNDRGATGGLNDDHSWAFGINPAQLFELVKSLPHTNDADTPPVGYKMASGSRQPNCSASSRPMVFLPSMR